jgi:hypothetical protein
MRKEIKPPPPPHLSMANYKSIFLVISVYKIVIKRVNPSIVLEYPDMSSDIGRRRIRGPFG